jgi:3-oxoacyl-(acyl-carrier-protein) synthase
MSLGEGAGILILEDLDEAEKTGAKILAEFLGYGIGGEAYHITAPEPTGSNEARIMKEAIEESVKVVLSNSFAFGGNCTTLILGKIDPDL